jgi:succinate dehydrogenase / fumarate reductase membrane anchor subunit
MLREKGFEPGGQFIWFFHRVSGFALVLLIILHFAYVHFTTDAGDGLVTFNDVMNRLSHPFFKVIDLSFLILALAHGLMGVMLTIQDYIRARGWRLVAVGTVWVLAIVFGIWGSVTILSLKPFEPGTTPEPVRKMTGLVQPVEDNQAFWPIVEDAR